MLSRIMIFSLGAANLVFASQEIPQETKSQDVIFARYGESTWKVEKRLQGQGILFKDKDGNLLYSLEEIYTGKYQIITGVNGEEFVDSSTLTEKGIEDAWELGEKVKISLGESKSIVLLSSDLLRAKKTTSIVEQVLKSSGIDVTVKYDARFREANHGRLSGKFADDLMKGDTTIYGYKNLDYYQEYQKLSPHERYELPMDPVFGEGYLDVTKRVHEAVNEYMNQFSGNNIYVITHGGPIRSIYTLFTNDPMPFMDEYETSALKKCSMMRVKGYNSEKPEITLE